MEIRLLSTLAVMGAMKPLGALYQDRFGCSIATVFSPTVGLLADIRGGAAGDCGILTGQGIDAMIAEGRMLPGSRVDIALSFVGVAVRAGAPKPDITTVEQFQAALLAARSVAYSKIGASGIYFAGLLEKMGMADRVNTVVVPTGFTAETLISGEADLAVQQISELLVVPGIEIVGPLPPAFQTSAVFSGGVLSNAANPDAARDFLRFLSGAEAAPILTKSGLQPMTQTS